MILANTSITKKFEFISDLNPISPYCEEESDIIDLLESGTSMHQKVSTIKVMVVLAFMTTVLFCPNCRKILGVIKS